MAAFLKTQKKSTEDNDSSVLLVLLCGYLIADCQLPIANLKNSNRQLEIGSKEIGNSQLAIGNRQ
jgi:hypothetical protein